MHLGITGTRKGLTEDQFNAIYNFVVDNVGISHLHEGDCIGVDYQLTLIFETIRPDVTIVRHPPLNIKTQANGPYDISWEPKPYLQRDKDIVRESKYLWAAPKGEEIVRSGTWATVRYARKRGIPITIIMPDGNIIYE